MRRPENASRHGNRFAQQRPGFFEALEIHKGDRAVDGCSDGLFPILRHARDSDGHSEFSFGVVLFRATAPLNSSTKRVVSAPLPVLALAGLIAISGLAPTTPFLVVVGQWGGAGGAICDDHLALTLARSSSSGVGVAE